MAILVLFPEKAKPWQEHQKSCLSKWKDFHEAAAENCYLHICQWETFSHKPGFSALHTETANKWQHESTFRVSRIGPLNIMTTCERGYKKCDEVKASKTWFNIEKSDLNFGDPLETLISSHPPLFPEATTVSCFLPNQRSKYFYTLFYNNFPSICSCLFTTLFLSLATVFH